MMHPIRTSLLLVLLAALSISSVSCLERIRYRDVLLQNQKKEKDATLLLKAPDNDHADVQELYLTQRLDHFDATNLAIYQQRYFYSDRYVVEDAASHPEVTFLCVGGEGPGFDTSVLVDSVHCSGDMLELAQRLSHNYRISVHVYALEHRYYGKSYPTFPNGESPVTNSHLKYLSSRQALEDLAHFVSTVKQQEGDSTWITFGGSYPGYMAMNARLWYPHLLDGAVSNSAPLDLKVDFPEYMRKVSWDLRYAKIGGSDQCFQIVKQGHEQAVDLLHTSPQQLARMFDICKPETALLERNNVNLLLGDGLIDIPAQGNDPSCTEPGCPNIATLCHTLVTAANKGNVTALQVLADHNHAQQQQQQQQGNDESCTPVDWEDMLNELTKPEVTDEGWRSWLWQTCTEVGFYQTCDETCPFASFFHLIDMDLEICRVVFNVTNVYDNVQASLDHYGGLDISGGSRVLSVNGNVDPWSVLGLQKSPKYSLPVQLVDGASHHFWTHPVRPTDAVEIVRIREYIYSVVMEWLGVEDRSSGRSSSSGISGGSSSSLRAGRVGGDYSSVLEG